MSFNAKQGKCNEIIEISVCASLVLTMVLSDATNARDKQHRPKITATSATKYAGVVVDRRNMRLPWVLFDQTEANQSGLRTFTCLAPVERAIVRLELTM